MKRRSTKSRKKIQNNPGLAHKRHFRSAGGNRLQMLLPKPKKEMFTTWCTLFTKSVPAVGPCLFFFSGMTSKQRIPRWSKAPQNREEDFGEDELCRDNQILFHFPDMGHTGIVPRVPWRNHLHYHLSGEIKPDFPGHDNKFIHLVWREKKGGGSVFRVVTKFMQKNFLPAVGQNSTVYEEEPGTRLSYDNFTKQNPIKFRTVC